MQEVGRTMGGIARLDVLKVGASFDFTRSWRGTDLALTMFNAMNEFQKDFLQKSVGKVTKMAVEH